MSFVEGGPDLGSGTLAERRNRFRETADQFRQRAINEPRGWDAVVGALLCEPADASCATGVIFFNNTGYLNMCGHSASVSPSRCTIWDGSTSAFNGLKHRSASLRSICSARMKSRLKTFRAIGIAVEVSVDVDQLGTVTN